MPENKISVEVQGIKDVNRALYKFSKQLGDRVVLSALRQGANIMLKQARTNVRSRTGKLKRNIVVKNSKIYSKRKGNGKLGVYISIRKKGKKENKNNAFYGRFVEDGWNTKGHRLSRRGGKGRSTAPGRTDVIGQKFMEKAFKQKRYQAVRFTQQAVKAGARIVAQRTGVKYG